MHFLSIAFLAFLINNISAYETCYSNSYITIYCEDGYKCCSDDYYYDYWCCKSPTHACGNDYMQCKMAAWLVIVIVLAIVLSISACVFFIVRRRRIQKRLREQQQPAIPPQVIYTVQGQTIQQPANLPPQVPYPMQGQVILQPPEQPIYYQPIQQAQPLQGQPIQGQPIAGEMQIPQQGNMGNYNQNQH